jgi:hypothetical protein
LKTIRDALDGYEPQGKPTLADVVARLGQVSRGAESQSAGEEPPVRRHNRRERRRGEAAS